jgi:hypothetical protein
MDVAAQEKRLKIKENSLDKRERDLNKKQAQQETAKTNIILLESRVKELKEENRILTIRLETTSQDTLPPVQNQNVSHTHQHQQATDISTVMNKLKVMESQQTENRLCDAEKEIMNMRMKMVENKVDTQPRELEMMMRISRLERDLTTQPLLQQTPLGTPYPVQQQQLWSNPAYPFHTPPPQANTFHPHYQPQQQPTGYQFPTPDVSLLTFPTRKPRHDFFMLHEKIMAGFSNLPHAPDDRRP